MNEAAPSPSATAPSPPPSSPSASASAPPILLSHEDRIAITRNHFARKGYRVHSGLQFGCELVLYADSPGRVHSDFCVHVVGGDDGGRLDWRTLQTLVRMMPDLHKTLIVANVRRLRPGEEKEEEEEVEMVDPGGGGNYDVAACDDNGDRESSRLLFKKYAVDELAIATEHAPFRHKNAPKGVGTQIKPQSRRK